MEQVAAHAQAPVRDALDGDRLNLGGGRVHPRRRPKAEDLRHALAGWRRERLMEVEEGRLPAAAAGDRPPAGQPPRLAVVSRGRERRSDCFHGVSFGTRNTSRVPSDGPLKLKTRSGTTGCSPGTWRDRIRSRELFSR